MEQTCGCATGVEKPGPGGTHRSEAARPAVSGRGPSLWGHRCRLEHGWALARPHGLTPQPRVDVAHALTWSQVFGVPRGGFLKTSVPRQLWSRLQLWFRHALGSLRVTFLFPLLFWTGLPFILSLH